MAMVKKIIYFLFLTFCLFPSLSITAAQDNTIRVAIMQDARSFYIRIKGGYEIRESANNRLIRKGKGIRKQKALVRADKIAAPSFTLAASRVQIVPLKGAYIYINNRMYRGKIDLIRKDNGHILIIN